MHANISEGALGPEGGVTRGTGKIEHMGDHEDERRKCMPKRMFCFAARRMEVCISRQRHQYRPFALCWRDPWWAVTLGERVWTCSF